MADENPSSGMDKLFLKCIVRLIFADILAFPMQAIVPGLKAENDAACIPQVVIPTMSELTGLDTVQFKVQCVPLKSLR